ncbi:MAG: hypothetical protein ACK522_15090 [Synechococcaceae cyanobacterium]
MGRAKRSTGLRATAQASPPSPQRPAPPNPDSLIALDLLCWLGSGKEASARLGWNPSTVSRKAESCAVSLGLLLRKRAGLWSLYGNGELLQAERDLHQRYRLAGYGPLRLEVCAELAEPLAAPPHPAWSSGGQRHLNGRRPLELLEQRVIDAWLCSFCEELPGEDGSCWQVLDLATLPLLLLADAGHPLLDLPSQEAPHPAALRAFPCLSLPEHAQPRRQAFLRHLGVADQPQPLERYDAGKWDEPLQDGLTLRPGIAFDLHRHPGWRALPFPLPHQVSIGLVLHRDLVDQAPIRELHQALQHWIASALS